MFKVDCYKNTAIVTKMIFGKIYYKESSQAPFKAYIKK